MAGKETLIEDLVLYAWVGEDELGSGEIGIKQALVPAGMIPMVAIDRDKIEQPGIVKQIGAMVMKYGKTVRLCRFVFQDVVHTIGRFKDED